MKDRYAVMLWKSKDDMQTLKKITNLDSKVKAINLANNLIKKNNYGFISIYDNELKKIIYQCTKTNSQYIDINEKDLKIQEKTNYYFSKVFNNKLIYDDFSIFGKLDEVLAEVNKYKEKVNREKDEYDEEEFNYETGLINNVLESLKVKDSKDVVCLQVQVMDGSYYLEDTNKTLKDLAQLYTEELLSKEKITNIEDFIEAYFIMNDIENLMEYGSDRDCYTNPTLSDLYKDLLTKLKVEFESVITDDISDGKYVTTITFNENESVDLYTKGGNTFKDVADNLKCLKQLNPELNLEME